jgi:hypothetical protein
MRCENGSSCQKSKARYFTNACEERNTPSLSWCVTTSFGEWSTDTYFPSFPLPILYHRLGSVLRYAANVFAKPDPISTIEWHVM